MNYIEGTTPQPLPNLEFTTMHDKEVWTFLTSDAHNPSPPTLFPPSRVPSSPVDFHAKAFARINHSLANLHLQQ